jgi:hypothetical protein
MRKTRWQSRSTFCIVGGIPPTVRQVMAINCLGGIFVDGLLVCGGIISSWEGKNALHLYPKIAN